MTNAQIARKLRKVAKRAEQVEAKTLGLDCSVKAAGMFFTCNKVECEFGSGTREGNAMADTYANVMIDDELDLWNDPDLASIRVLLLCFAAALAETGDLLNA